MIRAAASTQPFDGFLTAGVTGQISELRDEICLIRQAVADITGGSNTKESLWISLKRLTARQL